MSHTNSMSPVKLARLIAGGRAVNQRHYWGALGLAALLLFTFSPPAWAQDGAATGVDAIFAPIVEVMSLLLFFPIGGENGFAFIVLWLFVAALFFTLRLGFINMRGFKHAIEVMQGKYDDPHDAGEVSHFQALATVVSGTVGLEILPGWRSPFSWAARGRWCGLPWRGSAAW